MKRQKPPKFFFGLENHKSYKIALFFGEQCDINASNIAGRLKMDFKI